MKRYLAGSLYNMRDLGGYPVSGERHTSFRRIIRSDCPMELSLKDEEYLKELNISCVIDLRTQEERNRKPSHYSGVGFVEYHNVTFVNGNETPKTEDSIPYTYLKMMEEKDAIREILKIISEAEGAILYHCAVGKDRTGIVSALILGICGVELNDIVADYQVSETYIYQLLEEYRKDNPGLPEWVGRSKPEYMRDCLNKLMSKYGSFTEYMKVHDIPLQYKIDLENILIG